MIKLKRLKIVKFEKKLKIKGFKFLNVELLQEMFLGEYETLKRNFNDGRAQYAVYLAKLGRLWVIIFIISFKHINTDKNCKLMNMFDNNFFKRVSLKRCFISIVIIINNIFL